MAPAESYDKLGKIFAGSSAGGRLRHSFFMFFSGGRIEFQKSVSGTTALVVLNMR